MTTMEKAPLVLPADWVPGPRQGRWTYDEYSALPDDGPRYEIVNGVLYMAPSPSWSHQGVVGEIFAYLRTHVKLTGLGKGFMAPLDVELAPNTVVQPDVIVLLNASLAKLKEKHIISFTRSHPTKKVGGFCHNLNPPTWVTPRIEALLVQHPLLPNILKNTSHLQRCTLQTGLVVC